MAPDDALPSIPPLCYGVPLVAGTGCLVFVGDIRTVSA